MKILWVTNIALPEACQLMNEMCSPFGGWLVSASQILSLEEGIELSIAFPRTQSKDVMKFSGERINYFSFPTLHITEEATIREIALFKRLLKEIQPDVVHIFGTEFAHSYVIVNLCKEYKVKFAINIQGLISVIAKHYTAGLPLRVQKRFTFRDLLKQDNIIQQKKKFEKRGELEVEAIQKADHIIGRTTWDKACTTQINPYARYHYCNESLREEFYRHKWSIERCEKYSIFISQASYPIKGIHYMLEALPAILKRYPKTKLYIAGPDFISTNAIIDRLKKSSYAKYIEELIRKNRLENHVFFTGILDEKQMCERYLKSNVFVCPSSIENSPNSLGEAMILGVPSVASDVGGVSDMLKHNEEGFVYQADAPYMLAHYVCEIFGNDELALHFSNNARARARKTHDPLKNTNRLIEIYEEILQKKE